MAVSKIDLQASSLAIRLLKLSQLSEIDSLATRLCRNRLSLSQLPHLLLDSRGVMVRYVGVRVEESDLLGEDLLEVDREASLQAC